MVLSPCIHFHGHFWKVVLDVSTFVVEVIVLTFVLVGQSQVPIRDLGYDIQIVFQCGQGGSQTELMLNLASLVGFEADADGNDVITSTIQAALYFAADDFGGHRRVCTYPSGTADAFRSGQFELYLKSHNYIVSHEVLVDFSGLNLEQLSILAGEFWSF